MHTFSQYMKLSGVLCDPITEIIKAGLLLLIVLTKDALNLTILDGKRM